MNARITELIKNPESFRLEDFGVIDSLIKQHPYVQSLRAIQLYGTQLLNKEQYQENLSKTAAYTTDKKILYQFINKPSQALESESEANKTETEDTKHKPEQLQETNNVAIDEAQTDSSTTLAQENYLTVRAEEKPTPKPIYVDGELNRILFEGEENFLDEDHQGLDLESTLESGTLVVQKQVNQPEATPQEQIIIEPTSQVTAEREKESVESPIKNQKEVEHHIVETSENAAQVSFHGTEDFLPEVKMPVSNPAPVSLPSQEVKLSRHEEEMQRLIAEVEAKMKASKKDKPEQKPEVENISKNINFSEVQEFPVKTEDSESPTTVEISEEKTIDPEATLNSVNEDFTEVNKEWRPMSFESAKPDALIGKKSVEKTKDTPALSKPEQNQTIEKQEERPVMNLSFFTQQVASLEVNQQPELKEEEIIKVEAQVENEESNVPTFINTWQKWLKIDKSKPEEQPVKTEDKNKIIEEFIVKEPKISKLREESDFVVRERGDNIAHLMTETLAKLYIEQKLYTKAIQAYHILTEKHPDRKEAYDKMIQDIKNLRLNK